jgi:hypothetical protein
MNVYVGGENNNPTMNNKQGTKGNGDGWAD